MTYHHLLFARHQIILSDGVWTESFQPGAATLNGLEEAQRREVLRLFPELRDNPAHYESARITLRKREAQVFLSA